MKERTKIAVAGMGYVGLSVAALLAQHNHVVAVDIKPERVDMINLGMSPIRDLELQGMLGRGRLDLSATLEPKEAYAGAEFVVVAVPTNYDEVAHRFDTHIIEEVARMVLEVNPDATIIVKSTVPIGFTEALRLRLTTPTLQPKILFSPEFSREGRSLYDNLHPSRIIIGCQLTNMGPAQRFARLLKEGAEEPGAIPVMFMGESEAEAVKLFSNAYLAMRVAFFNELDSFAAFHGLMSRPIIEGMCHDGRIGQGYNNPSFGYGGYCFPKDTKQLRADYSKVPNAIISAIVESNAIRKDFITWSIISRLGERKRNVGVYRLAMKAGSDNSRESAIWDIMGGLKAKGYEITIYEPSIEPTGSYHGYRVTDDLARFKEWADIIVANRIDIELGDASEKVYTRDIFNDN